MVQRHPSSLEAISCSVCGPGRRFRPRISDSRGLLSPGLGQESIVSERTPEKEFHQALLQILKREIAWTVMAFQMVFLVDHRLHLECDPATCNAST
jgi:hypothetical protein